MAYIAPSLLAADFSALGKELERVQEAEILHIDIMDGCFVPNLSMGPQVVQALRPKGGQVFDVHLMLVRPLPYIALFRKAGADWITFHIESQDNPGKVIDAIVESGAKPGLALRPGTPVEELYPYGERLHSVTVMTVEPGFGGQAFLEHQLDTIRQVRALIERYNPACRLEVDGGISVKTAPAVVAAGADTLVAGSAVYGAAEPAAAIAALRGD